jgi:hypothetical protein
MRALRSFAATGCVWWVAGLGTPKTRTFERQTLQLQNICTCCDYQIGVCRLYVDLVPDWRTGS